MKNVWTYRWQRLMARLGALVFLILCSAPPAAAFRRPLTPEQQRRAALARREAKKPKPEVRELSAAEMRGMRGRGNKRNRAFSGVLPWQRSLRDVNLSTGNLFKSFTDIQVAPARGAGLAFQRTYNSSDDRVGPFGVGWTHAYDIRNEEAPNNKVERTDFFGGKHSYTRDADGLYSPPPYMFDELNSNYDQFLADGPPVVLDDTQKGKDGTVKHFFSNGTERSCDTLTDRHGNQTVLTYGLNIGGRSVLTKVTDPSGRYLNIQWTDVDASAGVAWRITQVQGPFDPVTTAAVYTVTYEYNSEFNLWKVHQDPAGLNRVTTYTYHPMLVHSEPGLLASISNPLGHTVSYAYTLQSITNSLWVSSVTEPGSGGNHVWTITGSYGDSSRPVVGGASSNGGLSVTCVSDGQLRKISLSSDGTYYRYYQQYDSANNVTASNSGDGNAPLIGQRTLYESTPATSVTATYGPHGNVITQSVSGFSGTTTTSYYNGSKYFQPASVTDPKGNVTNYDYFTSTDASVGNRGEVKWVRDARYATTGKQCSYTYNAYGQKLTETNLKDVLTQYTYGTSGASLGNLTQVVQDAGTGKLNRTSTVTYDAAGRALSSTDPKSQASSVIYNALGQPTQATLPGETVSYVYGANGRTESVTDGRGTTTPAYETGSDRVASVTDPVTGQTGYTYGLAGERLTISLPGGGTWTYELGWNMLPKDDPNSVGKMVWKLTDDGGRIVEYSQNVSGVLREVRNNQGTGTYMKTRYELDSGTGGATHGWTAQVKNTWHWQQYGNWMSKVLVQNDYTRDDNGCRLTNAISDQNGLVRTETYGYDALARLTSVNYGDGDTQSYTFDAMGNRLTKVHNGTSESYTYNNANMLLTRGAGSYTNDTNGNTLTGGGRTNTWDGQNRLTQCVYGGVTTNHTYGGDGLRRKTVQGTSTTDFILEGSNVIRTKLNGAVDKTYLHGLRGPEYERTGTGAPAWYLYDGLGSVLGTVDSTGTIISTRKYDVYGAVRGSTGPSGTKHKFVGNLGHPSEDETGLVYMRARYMDPVTGRFATEDPAKDETNWFTYAGNDPVNCIDANGKSRSPLEAMYAIGLYSIGAALTVGAMENYRLGNPNLAMDGANLALAAFSLALLGLPSLPPYLTILLLGGGMAAGGVLRSAQNALKVAAKSTNMTWARIAVTGAAVYCLIVSAAILTIDSE